jgi:CheY-like chemotaxis protein
MVSHSHTEINCSRERDLEVVDVRELDMTNTPSQEKGRDLQAGPAGGSGATSRAYGLLVVDDEASVRDILNTSMRQEGFAVHVATGGQEALELYRRHHETVDVVLMDVRMPGLDGPQTLAALQEVNPQVRCCLMSGDLGSYRADELKSRGAAAILTKPFDLAEVGRVLLEMAREALPTGPSIASPVY